MHMVAQKVIKKCRGQLKPNTETRRYLIPPHLDTPLIVISRTILGGRRPFDTP